MEPQLTVIVEIPLAITSVCMPSIFHLVRRAIFRGLPSLFSSQDRSKSLEGRHGRHISALANPIDDHKKGFERLDNGQKVHSEEGLVSYATAKQISESASQDVPLDDIRVREDIEVQINQSDAFGGALDRRHY